MIITGNRRAVSKQLLLSNYLGFTITTLWAFLQLLVFAAVHKYWPTQHFARLVISTG